MASSSPSPRSPLRQFSPVKMLETMRFRGFVSEEQLQAATRAFNRARGHASGLDCRRFRETLVREASAAMPHELAERVFVAWNRSTTGELNLEEFLDGVALVANGSREDHLRFVFALILNDRASSKIARDDTAAFLRFFGTPSTVIATFRQTSAQATATVSSTTPFSAESSHTVAQFCSSIHPSSASALTADEFVRLLSSGKWQDVELLVIVDWLRVVGDRLLAVITIDQRAEAASLRAARDSLSSPEITSAMPAAAESSPDRRRLSFRPWASSRHEREAIRRELDAFLRAPSDDIKCDDSVSVDDAIRKGYLQATKDSELVQAISGWTKFLSASCSCSTSHTENPDVMLLRRWREQHKRFVLGLCCAQSCSVLQVYRSLFALFDEDNRGRLTESDLAAFLFLTTPHYDQDDSERAAYEAMPSTTLMAPSSPPPSPGRDGQPARHARSIMTFMQFVDLAQQQQGLSAPEIEVVLLLFHLHAAMSLDATKPCLGREDSLAALLREFRDETAASATSDAHEIQSSGFYLCDESTWHQMAKQLCKLSDSTMSTLEPSSRRAETRDLAQILNDEAENVTSSHVLVPFPIWVIISLWFAHKHSSEKSTLDWRKWTTSTEMTKLLGAPPTYHVSAVISSSTDELAWNRSACIPHALVSADCTIQSIVDAACAIIRSVDTNKQLAAGDTGAPLKNYDCSLEWHGMKVGGLQISKDLLAIPLSVFIQNLPPRDEGIDEVPMLALKVTQSDASPTTTDATVDGELLAHEAPCAKRGKSWTTLRGLTNLGNTCFMNSALQSLAATPLLREYFQQGEYQFDQATTLRTPPHKHLLSLKRETTPPSLTQAFSQLLHELKSLSLAAEKGSANAVTPIKMYSALGALFPHMCDGTQQDAQEFISSFVSKLNEELKREPALSHQPDESVLSPQSRTILSRISTGQDAFPGSPNSGVGRFDSHELQKISPRDSDGRHDRIVAVEWWVSHLINEPSVITCFFSGQFKSVLTCSVCGKKSTRFEPFSSLQLPIANRERTAANALDATVVVNFVDSPRLRLPRRFVISAMNNWTIQDLLQKIAQDHLATPEQQPQPVLVAAMLHGSLIQEIYDEDMLLVAVPMPIHVLELDSSAINSAPTISMTSDPYGSVLTTRFDPAPGDDVLVRMSKDRLVKGVITVAHSHSRTTPSSFDVLLTEGMANGRTLRHTSDVVAKSAAIGRAVYLRFIHRHGVIAPFYCTTPQRQVVGGSPFMIRVAAGSLTGSALYNIVSRRFFGISATGSPRRVSRESAAPINRFVLRRVRDDGKSCGRCHWMHNCGGCLIDERGSELLGLEMDETIAIDWEDDDADTNTSADKNATTAAPYEPVPVEDDESYRSYRAQHSQSIADSLAMLCSEETLEARCSACQQQQKRQQKQRVPYTPHTKQLSIWSVPPVLVLQLKRFELAVSEQGDYSWQKLSDRVDFPVRGLHLTPFLSDGDGAHSHEAECSRRCTEILDERVLRGMAYLQDELGLPLDSASRSCTTYDLYAVINHTGELNSGHYTAVVRHPEDAASDDWWLADDATVLSADLSLLSPSATAYVLFYVRRDIATSAGDLINASLGLEDDRGDRFRRPSEFFPRRPNSSSPSEPVPLLPQKRQHDQHPHQRKEENAARGSDDARTRSGRGKVAGSGDNPMCVVM